MSLTLIRRECRDHNTVRCSCGRVVTVSDRRMDADRCGHCEARHKGWQAELMAPFVACRAVAGWLA